MTLSEIKSIIPNSSFLTGYALSVLLINVLTFFWAMSDDAVGLYVVMLVLFPLDIIFIIFGIIRSIILFRNKSIVNLFVYALVVFLVPVISGILIFTLVDYFAKNGGC